MVGRPGARWVPAQTIERFSRLELPDRWTATISERDMFWHRVEAF